ncbi:ATP-binding protein [Bacillus horti]|uniref:histidine kinase n=1 Tax=Caldalkalibacillus horti TaxID=77523 RepID=A0ABT9VV65_9BACI|nr:ATP-binding protein [Bacillus horti]MDQ0164888.1 signal transduction histidine kinase [Bacillus horti]
MSKQWLVLFVVCFLFIVVIPGYWVVQTIVSAQNNPQAVEGVLDLGDWDFSDDGIVRLTGEWEFYRNQLLEPADFSGSNSPSPTGIVSLPSKWNEYIAKEGESASGFATFRMVVKLQGDEGLYGVRTTNIRSANKVYMQGQLVGASGLPSGEEITGKESNIPYVGFASVTGNEVEILVQIANYSYSSGGMIYPLVFGDQSSVLKNREFHVLVDLLTAASFLIPVIYFLFLYSLRRKETALLYLGLFCLCALVYVLTHGEKLLVSALPGLSYEWFMKLQFIPSILAYLFIMLYVSVSFPNALSKWATILSKVLTTSAVIVAIILPVQLFSQWEIILFMVAFAMMCYVMYALFAAMKRHLEDALFLFMSIQSIIVVMFVNILYVNGMFEGQAIAAYEMLLFVVAQAMLLAKTYAQSFEEVEQLSQRLLTLDGLKDEFLANTSHELRTPLHGIINISESLLQGAAGSMNEKQSKDLSLVVSTGKRLSSLINDLLDFSKLKNGEVTLNRKAVGLQAVFESVLEVATHLVGNKKIEFVQKWPTHMPFVYADEDKLHQILYNLLGNAIKFTSEGEIRVGASIEKGQVTVSIVDTGIGIEEKRLIDLFKPYDQLEVPYEQEGYSGTGLGLSITKRLVELGDGRIWVKSKVGVGSSFYFTLPLAKEGVSLEGVKREQALPLRQIELSYLQGQERQEKEYTILVVDDDPINLRVLLNLLSLENYAVIAVSDGERAYEEIQRNRQIDLLIVDWMMPNLSGLELSRRIRERFLLSELPILMLTARSRSEDIQTGFQAGINDFLSKPVDAEELKARVRTLLQLRRSVQAVVQTEMAFLQAQIKPHFLFNALNTIIALCPVEPDKAMQLLWELSQYLRSSFDFHHREEKVSLQKELQLVKSYLSLEQGRFEERLTMHYDIDESIQVQVPPLSIQPIVENAVRHGIMKKAAGGSIWLKVWEDVVRQKVMVTVTDDGLGMTPEMVQQLFRERETGEDRGVGILNIHRRLQMFYGEGLHIESQPGQGTVVRFEIPSMIVEDEGVSSD